MARRGASPPPGRRAEGTGGQTARRARQPDAGRALGRVVTLASPLQEEEEEGPACLLCSKARGGCCGCLLPHAHCLHRAAAGASSGLGLPQRRSAGRPSPPAQPLGARGAWRRRGRPPARAQRGAGRGGRAGARGCAAPRPEPREPLGRQGSDFISRPPYQTPNWDKMAC